MHFSFGISTLSLHVDLLLTKIAIRFTVPICKNIRTKKNREREREREIVTLSHLRIPYRIPDVPRAVAVVDNGGQAG